MAAILFVVAAVLFGIAAVVPSRAPVHLGWVGAALVAVGLALGGS